MIQRTLALLGSYWRFILKRKTPTYSRSIYEIDYSSLKNNKLLIFDVDDTICGFHEQISPKVISFLSSLSKKFNIALLSNTKQERVLYLKKIFNNTSIYVANDGGKPDTTELNKVLKKFKCNPSETVMVGDRVGTDFFLARRGKLFQFILVNPFSLEFNVKKAPLLLRVLSKVEKIIFL